MGRRRQDAYGHRARREGFAARSVYKLAEIDRRVRLFRPGLRVLDLGAAPGSWTQYAAEKVGASGYVLGLDLQEQTRPMPKPAEFLQIDVCAFELGDRKPFDVVMSDMAPSTSGQRHADQFKSFELTMRALEIAETALRPGGNAVAKIFQGPELGAAKQRLAELFETPRIIRPEATRKESYELFLVGLGRKPRAG